MEVRELGTVDSGEPPAFIRLAAHRVRWRLLGELARSDRAVRELVALVGEPQNLVSYHLRILRTAGLVTAHRSSADRRDSYYSIDLDACRMGLQAGGSALHPALELEAPTLTAMVLGPTRWRVLFLCTGNSARSQIAEALAGQLSGGVIEAHSAGSHPKAVHPNAIRVLAARGVDIATNRSKGVDEFAGQRFDTVITLCDRVREVRTALAGRAERVHWSLPDPSRAAVNNDLSYPKFEQTAKELETRIGYRLHLLKRASRTGRTRHGNQ